MSENLEKLRGVDRLPVFPLPLVLLPNEMLPLHIFEDRYQEMLADISHTGNMFGITLFEPAQPFIERPALDTIGCVAEVREIEKLDDGRANIVVLGLVRYRLLGYAETGSGYLTGELQFFDDDVEDPAKLEPLADEVFRIFERVAKAAFKLSGKRGAFPEIARTDAESFSFLCSAAFSFENELKYRLLETTSTVERLEKLRDVLVKAAGGLEESAEIRHAAETNGHSKKKLDL
jgi:ATP-dependent Lon protease